MHPVLEKVEWLADKLIVPALLLILVIVGMEIFFTETAHHYDVWLNFADFLVIIVFATDLSFKLHRASTWEGFLREYWLEIIAIMPMFAVFRVIELLLVPTAALEVGQDAAHLGTRSERFAAVFRSSELGRSTRFGQFVRVLSRSPRFARAAEFFGEPGEK